MNKAAFAAMAGFWQDVYDVYSGRIYPFSGNFKHEKLV